LSNEVGMDEMARILGEVRDPEEAAARLVDVANEHGGADNITVIVVDVQVGEDGTDGPAKVTPIGASTAAITVASASAAAAAVSNGAPASAATEEPAADGAEADAESDVTQTLPLSEIAALPAFSDSASDSDTLAPGARLGFGSETRTLGEDGPRGDEFFAGTATAGTVSVARTSTRVPLAEQAPVADETSPKRKEKETRRQRRNRLGIPRRVTFRVLGFVILVAAVPIAAYFVLRWYAYDNWTVTLRGGQVVILQGQPGGVLWFHPKVVDRTGVKKDQLSTAAASALAVGVQKASLHDARTWVSTVTTTSTTTTTTTTVPNGSTTTTKPATAGGIP
jgi:hypothetical protein